MERKKLNRAVACGLLVFSVTNIARQLFPVPEFFKGLGLGLAISLFLLGMMSEKHGTLRVRAFKKNILTKLIG